MSCGQKSKKKTKTKTKTKNQKQYCNKFNKNFKNCPYGKVILKKID